MKYIKYIYIINFPSNISLKFVSYIHKYVCMHKHTVLVFGKKICFISSKYRVCNALEGILQLKSIKFYFPKKDKRGKPPKALKQNIIMQMIMTLGMFLCWLSCL